MRKRGNEDEEEESGIAKKGGVDLNTNNTNININTDGSEDVIPKSLILHTTLLKYYYCKTLLVIILWLYSITSYRGSRESWKLEPIRAYHYCT